MTDSLARSSQTPLPPLRRTSLTSQTREALLDAILQNRFDDGRLPPEDAIAEALGVSRTVVRNALQSLEEIGLIDRTPGRGTLVRKHAGPALLGLHRLVGFSTLLSEQGYSVSSDVSWVLTAEISEDNLDLLRVAKGTNCYVLRKLIRADDAPAISIVDYFPASVTTRPFEVDDLIPDSAFEMSEQLFKDRIHHAIVEIVPRTTNEEEAETLALPRGSPFLQLREKHYSRDDNLLGLTVIDVNPIFVLFEVVRRND